MAGFNFDTAAVTSAGQYQNASCPTGQLGYQTRLCQWNGYGSATGTFVNPVNYCVGADAGPSRLGSGRWAHTAASARTAARAVVAGITCPSLVASNATFASGTLVGQTSGSCQPGFAGSISSTCLVYANSTAYWSAATGTGCARTGLRGGRRTSAGVLTSRTCARARANGRGSPVLTCSAYTFGNAQWPTVTPGGASVAVNGTCASGYQPTNPSSPAQQVCLFSGAYSNSVTNPCIRTAADADCVLRARLTRRRPTVGGARAQRRRARRCRAASTRRGPSPRAARP